MAGSMTNYLRTKLLQQTLGITPWTMPATVYVALTTTLPSNSAGGAEPSPAAGYVRRAATMAMDDGGRPDLAENSALIEWPPATAPWGTLGWFEVWDAASGGNRLLWGELVSPLDLLTPITVPVITGDQVRMPITTLQIQSI